MTEGIQLLPFFSVEISISDRGNRAFAFSLGSAFSVRPREFSSCLFSRLKFRFLTEGTGLLLFSRFSFFSLTEEIQLLSFSSVGLRTVLPTNRANRSFGRYAFCKRYRPNKQIKLLLGRSPDSAADKSSKSFIWSVCFLYELPTK